MIPEIQRDLIKTEENKIMTSKQVLAWAKRDEVQRAQSEIIDSLSETKDFDRIKTVRSEHRQMVRKLCTPAKMPVKQNCSYCGSTHPCRQNPAYGKKCAVYSKMNHFREVFRSKRGRLVHHVEQEPNLYQEDEVRIGIMNINSISFKSKHSIITANSKTSTN